MGPQVSTLVEVSSVVQAIVVFVSVVPWSCGLPMTGATQSTAAVVVTGTFWCPWPSSASMYRTVIGSPCATESCPSPCAGGAAVSGIVPRYFPEPASVCCRLTDSGWGSVVEETLAASGPAPALRG